MRWISMVTLFSLVFLADAIEWLLGVDGLATYIVAVPVAGLLGGLAVTADNWLAGRSRPGTKSAPPIS